MAAPAPTVQCGAYPEVTPALQVARSDPWGVFPPFLKIGRVRGEIIVAAMAAFAVEPQVPSLGE